MYRICIRFTEVLLVCAFHLGRLVAVITGFINAIIMPITMLATLPTWCNPSNNPLTFSKSRRQVVSKS